MGLLQWRLPVSVWLDSVDGIADNATDREAKAGVIAVGESCERRIPGSGLTTVTAAFNASAI
jgi:hypothetical protein